MLLSTWGITNNPVVAVQRCHGVQGQGCFVPGRLLLPPVRMGRVSWAKCHDMLGVGIFAVWILGGFEHAWLAILGHLRPGAKWSAGLWCCANVIGQTLADGRLTSSRDVDVSVHHWRFALIPFLTGLRPPEFILARGAQALANSIGAVGLFVCFGGVVPWPMRTRSCWCLLACWPHWHVGGAALVCVGSVE